MTFVDFSGLDRRGSIRALYLLHTYLGLLVVLFHDLVCNFGMTSLDLALSLDVIEYLMI